MSSERWEVRGPSYTARSKTRHDAKCNRAMLISRGWVPEQLRIVRVRTFAVVSAWAWRAELLPGDPWYGPKGPTTWWWSQCGWRDHAARRFYPTRAAALAARPSAEAVLVRIRRRVRE